MCQLARDQGTHGTSAVLRPAIRSVRLREPEGLFCLDGHVVPHVLAVLFILTSGSTVRQEVKGREV